MMFSHCVLLRAIYHNFLGFYVNVQIIDKGKTLGLHVVLGFYQLEQDLQTLLCVQQGPKN